MELHYIANIPNETNYYIIFIKFDIEVIFPDMNNH